MMKTPTRIAMVAALAAAFLAAGGKDRGPSNGPAPDTVRAAEVRTTAAGSVSHTQLASDFSSLTLGMNR